MTERVLYETTLAICAMDNAPRWADREISHEHAYQCGLEVRFQRPELVAITEEWWPEVQEGFAKGLGSEYELHQVPGESAGTAWRTDVWESIAGGVLVGGAAGRIPFVNDRRDTPWDHLQRLDHGRRLTLPAIHTAPIPTRKAPLSVPLARASHARARRRLRAWAEQSPYPVLFAGDFNESHLIPAARRFGPPGIVHAETLPGEAYELRAVAMRRFPLVSDHQGVLIGFEALAR